MAGIWMRACTLSARDLFGAETVDVLIQRVAGDLPQFADLDRLDLARGAEVEHVGPADPKQPRGLGQGQDSGEVPSLFRAGRAQDESGGLPGIGLPTRATGISRSGRSPR